jgi:dihydrofolate synthase/folylpolyglutamate synthase
VRTYVEAVQYLQALEVARGWDLSLARMEAALARRGRPERRVAAIHVAGTNGKGSTAAMMEACLRAGGYRTGLYTSPHLVDFAERIRAGGRTIPHDTVVELVADVRATLAPAGLALTHFEFVTLMAFEWFARIGVEAAVIEVGLGGRLDATNVLEPRCAVVTSIAMDHEAFLGDRLDQIAAEKAGIVKPGVPVCVGRLAPEAAAVVATRAAAVGAPLWCAGTDGILAAARTGDVFRGPGTCWNDLRVRLRGAFQRDNAEVALLALAVAREWWPLDETAVRTGLAHVVWPGRLAVVREQPRVILDGAHNTAAIEAVVAELSGLCEGRPLTLVFAAMQDKAWALEIERLLPHVVDVVMTGVGRRAENARRLADAVAGRCPVAVVEDPRDAVRLAIERAGTGGVVLVTGSLFLVAEAYAALGDTLFETWHGWEGDGTHPRR